MPFLDYGDQELVYLAKRDKKLAALIERSGYLHCELRENLFASIIRSIAIQQISNKAAETVCRRLEEQFPGVTPQVLGKVSAEQIQKIGISMRKAGYIKGVCDAALSGEIDFELLREMNEEDIMLKLTALKGVGVWTVEMLLLFSLGHKDVLSWNDYAIRKGICLLYGHKELDRSRFDRYRKRYSPYGSVASLYLWHQFH